MNPLTRPVEACYWRREGGREGEIGRERDGVVSYICVSLYVCVCECILHIYRCVCIYIYKYVDIDMYVYMVELEFKFKLAAAEPSSHDLFMLFTPSTSWFHPHQRPNETPQKLVERRWLVSYVGSSFPPPKKTKKKTKNKPRM